MTRGAYALHLSGAGLAALAGIPVLAYGGLYLIALALGVVGLARGAPDAAFGLFYGLTIGPIFTLAGGGMLWGATRWAVWASARRRGTTA